ncbi:hypothetical protein PHO31112_03313 [Pandoraea horticolens]|uniref:Uncharacterized protein n=1 Tax=Pandoraea horticolens TaxID=2508298 RepID=A0A5E4WJU1_9BURK|nr:hypothetical protein [Pandoraea horticolens]VVE24741.1 hypothetical protein PHO31112_03313 [Pandoraea horticolens]
MTSLVSTTPVVRDSLDKLHSLSERLVALCMVAANQENTESIPHEFANAYFEQMGDLADEVLDLTQRLDDDLSLAKNPALAPI